MRSAVNNLDIVESIMTYDELNELEYTSPYTFVIKNQDVILYYFGERHSFNPEDEQWKLEKEFWNNFLKDTNGKKRIVFIEGGAWDTASTEKESILESGGGGLVTFLAVQNGIGVYSPEPSHIQELAELEKNFSREQIQYCFFARTALQWNKKELPRPDFETYMTPYFERDARVSGWKNIDFSLVGMNKMHKNIFGTDFNPEDRQFLYNVTNPAQSETVINKVIRASSQIRDAYVVGEIQKYLQDGYSIYVQFGATHAVMQEPAIKRVMG